MSEELTIASVQHVSTPGDVDAGLARIAHYAQKAQLVGADLLLFPEASLTGYNNSLDITQQVAVPAKGDVTDVISKICRDHKLAIAYGFAERRDKQIYNSVQLINADGDAVAIYSKTHLWGKQDRTLFSAGEDFSPVVEWNGWRIGFLICYDIEFPENVRRLAIEGAELLLTPTALMSPFTTVADRVVPVRAYESQVFIAYANFCGSEYDQHYVGNSCIVGPDCETLAKANDAEEMLVATLHKSSISENRSILPYHNDRRPELYKVLVD